MKTAVVTGSASGMGAAIRRNFEAAGHRVIGIDRHEGEVVAELSTPEGRTAAIESTLRLSEGCIDCLVCCAGLGPHVEPVTAVASVNYFGTTELLDGLLPALQRGSAACAVAITSVDASLFPLQHKDGALRAAYLANDESRVHELLRAFEPAAYAGAAAYGSAKNAATVAVRQRVRSWAKAGVRLNAVAPGAVQTPLLQGTEQDPRYAQAIRAFVSPIGRRAQPEEIAAAVDYLCSDAAAFVHGSVLFIDGGIDAATRPTAF